MMAANGTELLADIHPDWMPGEDPVQFKSDPHPPALIPVARLHWTPDPEEILTSVLPTSPPSCYMVFALDGGPGATPQSMDARHGGHEKVPIDYTIWEWQGITEAELFDIEWAFLNTFGSPELTRALGFGCRIDSCTRLTSAGDANAENGNFVTRGITIIV